MTEKRGFTIDLISPPDRERLQAEIYFDGKYVATVSQERGEGLFDLETPGPDLVENLITRKVDLTGFQNAVEKACRRLKPPRVKLDVKPIYGWGWHNREGAVEVPPQFELEATVIETDQPHLFVLGHFKQSQHPLSGHWIQLEQRAPAADTGAVDCNLLAYREMPIVALKLKPAAEKAVFTGYATVQIEAPTPKNPGQLP